MASWTAAEAHAAMAVAAPATLDDLCPAGPIAVVAPHPDDESLGCGGLIALAAQSGRPVCVAILTDGAASHPNSLAFPASRLASLRAQEARDAASALGPGVDLHLYGAPDGALERQEAEATAWLAALLARLGAVSVFAPWVADPHADHKAAHRIAQAAAAPIGARLWSYPVWGLTLAGREPAGPALACRRLDVSSVLHCKAAAIAAHRSQTTELIADDPQGFRLTPSDLARHLDGWEVFLRDGGAGVGAA